MNPDIITLLWDLHQRISSHGGVMDDSMFERYVYFINHSEYKNECVYAKKCKDLILRHDYEDIKNLFLKVLEQFRVIEGLDFGKK